MKRMPNVIKNHISLLKRFHYVSGISRKTDYWGGLKLPSLEKYHSEYNDNFNVIIYDSQGSREFYSIPYVAIKPKLDITKGYLPNQRRWQYSIINHILRIHGSDEALVVSKYFLNYSNIPQLVELVEDFYDFNETGDTRMYTEGGRKPYITTRLERNPVLRKKAIKIHGTSCQVCGFNFYERYGEIGLGFIEVHHKNPVSEYGDEIRDVHPETDLSVLCPNCHRMVHRKREKVLSIEELQEQIE